jgi:hypothetical protein
MKSNLARKFTLLAMLLVVAAILAGCKTTPPIDWNSRVGNYTYDQAVTELGPPDKQAKLSDGKMVAEWITHRNGGSGFGVGLGGFSGGMGVGVSQSVGSSYPDRILTLTFGTDNKLVSAGKIIEDSIQRHAAPDVSRDVQILALMDGRLAFVEAALGNDRQRQLRLQHF